MKRRTAPQGACNVDRTQTRENAPHANITVSFHDWHDSEKMTACNACWAYLEDLNLDNGRFEKCLCGKESCRLVWCSKPDPEAHPESCAALRYLHERMEIDEDTMFSFSQPGDPADEMLTAQYFMRHGGVIPGCPDCSSPMVIDREEGKDPSEIGPNAMTCPECGHVREMPPDLEMKDAGNAKLPGMPE